MKQITFPDNIEPLISQIKNGNAVAVTDASLSPYTGIGASSFTITTTDLQISCCGSHGVPEGSSPIDSYCAELYGIYGIYGIMICLQYLVTKHDIQHGSIIIACDNKASINNSFQYKLRVIRAYGNFDMFWAMQQIHKNPPLTIFYNM